MHHATGEALRMKMLLRIAAQTFNLIYQQYASSGLLRDTEIECRFQSFECVFRKFNLSSDWFGNFECRFADFQRPTV